MIAWFLREICVGNSMICIDIWHKYHEWYFQIVIRNLSQFWNITSGIYAKYHIQIMLLFVYTTTLKRFVIFTCSYFKLSWNTTALSQSNCRNFSCSSIRHKNHSWCSKIVSNFTRLKCREITYDNFEISLVVFMPNISRNHAVTYTYTTTWEMSAIWLA